jgi:TatD DNase family protein
MYVDSHCHLDHPSLSTRLDEVLASARAAGVERFIVPGVSPEKWEGISRLAAETPGVFPALGLHPMLAARYDEPLLEDLARYAGKGYHWRNRLDYLSGVSREEQVKASRSAASLSDGTSGDHSLSEGLP